MNIDTPGAQAVLAMFMIEVNFIIFERKVCEMNLQENFLLNLKRDSEVYFKQFFGRMSNRTLVRQEQILSDLIKSELVCDLILIDEIAFVHGLMRDECLKRLALSVCDESE